MPLRRFVAVLSAVVLLAGFLLPQDLIIPVRGATPRNWNAGYFWNCPWCSGDRIHYGIDIIYKNHTPVVAAGGGLVIYRGWQGRGGQVVMVLGAGWRIHYYAHLDEYRVLLLQAVAQGQELGLLGNTGASDLPHLHYGIFTPVPRPWLWDRDRFGWRKMFFLNPTTELLRK